MCMFLSNLVDYESSIQYTLHTCSISPSFWCAHARCLPRHLTATLQTTLQHNATRLYFCTVSRQVASRTGRWGAIHEVCSVMQVPRSKGACVAACCSMLQCRCVAVDQRLATQFPRFRSVCICSMLHCVAVLLQSVFYSEPATRYSVLQCVAVQWTSRSLRKSRTP